MWTVGLLVLYNFCANLANDIYLPSMPYMTTIFNVSSSTMQLTMMSWFAGIAMPQLIFGPLSDKIGRRPLILYGGLCFLSATFFCMLATNVWTLMIGRFFQGIGVSTLNVTSYSIVTDLYDYKSRGKYINLITTFGSMAPLFGPIIGGYIFTWFGWQANFMFVFILGLACIIGLVFKLPESNLSLNVNALHSKHIFRNYRLLIQNHAFVQSLLPYCLILGGLVAYLTAAPFIIINKFKISPELFGFYQLPVFFSYTFGTFYMSWKSGHIQTSRWITIGLIIALVGSLILFLLNLIDHNNVLFFITPMIVYAIGASLCTGQLINEAMTTATIGKGSASAFVGFSAALGCVFSNLLLSLLYDGRIFTVSSLIILFSLSAIVVYFSVQRPDL